MRHAWIRGIAMDLVDLDGFLREEPMCFARRLASPRARDRRIRFSL